MEADVCIVGAGAAGGILALELARRNFNLSQIREKFWGAIDQSLER